MVSFTTRSIDSIKHLYSCDKALIIGVSDVLFAASCCTLGFLTLRVLFLYPKSVPNAPE